MNFVKVLYSLINCKYNNYIFYQRCLVRFFGLISCEFYNSTAVQLLIVLQEDVFSRNICNIINKKKKKVAFSSSPVQPHMQPFSLLLQSL